MKQFLELIDQLSFTAGQLFAIVVLSIIVLIMMGRFGLAKKIVGKIGRAILWLIQGVIWIILSILAWPFGLKVTWPGKKKKKK